MADAQSTSDYDEKIRWEFSHVELSICLVALFAVFFLGYFTRSWTDIQPKYEPVVAAQTAARPTVTMVFEDRCSMEKLVGGLDLSNHQTMLNITIDYAWTTPLRCGGN